ncbi:MAG: T9SS type A sorting domain-containing protein, partial [Flavobacteriaceae bacterium]|nr:T9SS type A sorting domain-containing protein [Flavobacteriaceae bacterium]
VLGGAQDNGSTAGGTGFGLPDLTTQVMVNGGDGVSVAITRDLGCLTGFVGSQGGNIIRGNCDGSPGVNITPSNSQSQFVTYFYLDPDNNNALYYAGLNTLYKTADASNVTPSIWDNLGDTGSELGVTDWFQTFSTTRGTYDQATSFLLMGGDEGKIYKLNDPQNATSLSQSIDITPPTATLGFPSIVTGLAIHPSNKDIVLATYSNYGTESIFLTTNATSATPTWTLVERNLSAFSIRSAAIGEVNGEVLYFVGTARGLFSSPDPTTQDWIREAPNQIGFALVSSLAYRPADNRLLIGTFGNGMYEATITETLSLDDVALIESAKLYPNPTSAELNIRVAANVQLGNNYLIRNSLGQTIDRGELNHNSLNVAALQSGLYFIQVEVNNRLISKRFIKR